MSSSEAAPPLRVTQETRPGAVVVRAAGEIDAAVKDVLSRRLDEAGAAAASAGLLVLDLSAVTFLDSAGLAVLVDRKQRCAGLGVRFTVVAGQRAVTRVVEVAGLADHLALVPTLADALG